MLKYGARIPQDIKAKMLIEFEFTNIRNYFEKYNPEMSASEIKDEIKNISDSPYLAFGQINSLKYLTLSLQLCLFGIILVLKIFIR